jgi:hypothetical protein
MDFFWGQGQDQAPLAPFAAHWGRQQQPLLLHLLQLLSVPSPNENVSWSNDLENGLKRREGMEGGEMHCISSST